MPNQKIIDSYHSLVREIYTDYLRKNGYRHSGNKKKYIYMNTVDGIVKTIEFTLRHIEGSTGIVAIQVNARFVNEKEVIYRNEIEGVSQYEKSIPFRYKYMSEGSNSKKNTIFEEIKEKEKILTISRLTDISCSKEQIINLLKSELREFDSLASEQDLLHYLSTEKGKRTKTFMKETKRCRISYLLIMIILGIFYIGIGIYCANPIPIAGVFVIYYIRICMNMPYERFKLLKYIPIAEFIASVVMFCFIYNGRWKGEYIESAMLGTFFCSFLKGVSYIYIGTAMRKAR